jgi:pilus assembly protein CpaB
MIRAATPNSGLNRRTITFIIAGILALGTGWLTFTYLNSVNRSVTEVVAPRVVVVAVRDIPARATITSDMLTTVRRPGNAVDSDSLAVPSIAVGQIARVSIPTGSAVTASKIGHILDTGLTERIQHGMRAMSIPIDKVKGVSNLIQAGDHVDVIALTHGEPGVAPRALTILRNTVVLAMGATYESTTAASPSPDASLTTATLEVTPRQADLLALADVNTTLRLDLRQPKELTGPIPPDALVLSAPPVQQRGAAPAAGPAAPAQQRAPAPRPTNPVQVITGDQIAGDRSAGGR